MKKRLTTIRMSPEGQRLIAILASRMAVSKSAIIELAIRQMAKCELGVIEERATKREE